MEQKRVQVSPKEQRDQKGSVAEMERRDDKT